MEQEIEQRFRLLGFGVQLTLVGIALVVASIELGFVLVFVGTIFALGGIV